MIKLGIVAHRSDFEDLSSRLAELGVVQLSTAPEKPKEAGRDLEELLGEIDRTISFLARFQDKESAKLKLTYEQLAQLPREFDVEETIEKVGMNKKNLEKLEAKKNTLKQTIANLEPYSTVPYSLAELTSTAWVGTKIGFLPKDYKIEFLEDNIDKADLFHLRTYNTDPNGEYVLILYHRSIEDEVGKLLADWDFAEFRPGKLKDSPEVELSKARAELTKIHQEIREINNIIKSDAKELIPRLNALRGYFAAELAEKNLYDLADKTEQTFYLTGWVKQSDFAHLRESLSREFEAVLIQAINPDEGEAPPVALKNPPVVEAFEVITDLYGRPRLGMVDPTPFIAPFFPIFFGLCLTDAGYGLLISLLGAGLLLFGNMKKPGTRKFLRFILYSGIATVILGALAGGWFGMDLSASDSAIAKALLSVKLFDPLSNAIQFFAACIFFGVIQVAVGFGISGYIGFKESPNTALRLKALLSSIAWIAVTIGAGTFVANYLIPETIGPFVGIATNLIKYGALGILAFSIVLGIAGKRGLGGAIGDGLGFDGLYGIVGLFGDLLSYARILALGLSTGVIAGVINIIAKQITEMIPGVGFVFAALLVIVGHIAYTGISALGAFVHPARLHFVEYFTKFYEAGGEPFEPFKRKIDGVEIVE